MLQSIPVTVTPLGIWESKQWAAYCVTVTAKDCTKLIIVSRVVDNRIAFRFGFGQIIRSEYIRSKHFVLFSCLGIRQKKLILAKIDIFGQNTLFRPNVH